MLSQISRIVRTARALARKTRNLARVARVRARKGFVRIAVLSFEQKEVSRRVLWLASFK
jgi:hypothetical protein